MQVAFSFDQLPQAVSQLLQKVEAIEQRLIAADQSRPPAFIGIKDAAKIVHLSVPTLYTLVHRREIPHHKKGNRLYFLESELIAWIEEGRRKIPNT